MRTLGYLRLRDQLWLMTIFKYLEICMGPEIFHLSICLGILLESSTPPPVEINISYAFAGTSVRIESEGLVAFASKCFCQFCVCKIGRQSTVQRRRHLYGAQLCTLVVEHNWNKNGALCSSTIQISARFSRNPLTRLSPKNCEVCRTI